MSEIPEPWERYDTGELPKHFNCRCTPADMTMPRDPRVEAAKARRRQANMELLAHVYGCPLHLVDEVLRVRMKDLEEP